MMQSGGPREAIHADPVARDQLRKYIAELPKVELHVHLEGCLEPEMALRFARRNGADFPYYSVDEVREASQFNDLPSFVKAIAANTKTLKTVDDHYELARTYLERIQGENVVHVELAMSPQGIMMRGLEVAPCIQAIASAFQEARKDFGLTGGIIAGIMRHRPPEEALDMLSLLRSCADDILAIGLHGAESGYEPALFERHFELARSEGWHCVAHAGEDGPASYIWQALDVLKAERIDHGVRADEDPELVRRLAQEQIPLTVCPVSNVYLNVVPKLEDHNIAQLLRGGLAVSLHSDDPAFFGGYLSDHFEQTALSLDLSFAEIAQLNRNAISAAFVDAHRKQQLMDATRATMTA